PILDAQGKNLDDYAGVCRIIAEQAYDANTQTWRLAGRGGGFTSGVTEGTEDPGWSWWRACAEDYFIPDAWLFVHEYGHQIDAMYHASGGPEFWGNHFAPQEGNVARFGEHFDGMAYVLRWWEPSKYFGSDWGTVEFAVDVDGDGIPDDAPELPIDEKRFGSDSTETDTDNDGLSDIDELKLLNTVERGLGQIWAAPILPDPTDPDTDGDGERDGDDGQPLYRNTAIGPPDVPTEFRPIIGAGMTCSVGGAWGPDGLEIDWQTDEPRRVMIQIDADNDGWFVGRDNYHITIDPPSTDGEAPRVNAHIMNCAEPGKWPFDDKDLIEAGDLECFVIDGMTGYQLKLILGPSPETGLELKAGETIGINYGVAHPIRNATFLMAFQPHSLVPMTLEEF
ncbi:MAG TPA: hypothetical protein QGH10_12295, partial [Armatimonadota bacterium]|nr:hypothetical protein [Armatimonadota bacterium]